MLSGPIDTAMRDCARQRFAPTTRTVVLDSEGGSVDEALDIAALFEGRGLIMAVENECNSSCANYFLPLARRIEMAPGAMILLHGSIDPQFVTDLAEGRDAFVKERRAEGLGQADAKAAYDRALPRSRATQQRQAAFAKRNRIPPGWLLYREAGSSQVVGLSSGRRGGPGRTALLVEEPLLRSCLPGVEIVPFQADLTRHWTHSWRRVGLMWSGIAFSGSSVCIDT